MKLMRLSLPFAWVAATLLVLPGSMLVCAWIAAAAVVGRVLTRRLGDLGLWELLGAGFLGGAAANLPYILECGWVAPLAGAICGFAGAMTLAPVVGAAEWVKARPGSLLDGVGIRCTWIVAALVSLVFVCWARHMMLSTALASPSLMASSLIVIGCTAMDAWRLITLTKWRRDLGVGDPEFRMAIQGSPFRPEPRVLSVVQGDLQLTRKILRRQLAFDVAVLMLTLTGISGALTT